MMSDALPLAPGTQLGRYQILWLAGEGGMGDVYLALDESLKRRVALKRVRADAEAMNRERFRREALALAQLNHPGICQVHEVAETAQGLFIVMEWIEGDTLAERLQRGPLPWREAASLLRQAAEALAAAHDKGLVHRDLKPGNLMITAEGQVKILDFGLVRFTDEELDLEAEGAGEAVTDPGRPPTSGSGRALTRTDAFIGTPGYASPEQALRLPVGPPSDIFNLGLLAQEMVTGARALPGEDRRREPLPRRAAPKAFRALAERMLAPLPADRPKADEVAEELRRQLAPLGALWWSGLSAALALLLGAGGLWIYSRGALAGLVKGRPARVVILGFKNETGIASLDAQTELGLPDLLAANLRKSRCLVILDAKELQQAAKALRIDPVKASPEDQRRLAKAIGADLVLTGEVRRNQSLDLLHFVMADLAGKVRTEGSAEAALPANPSASIAANPLAIQSSRKIDQTVDPLHREGSGPSFTISPEAFAAYASGMEAYQYGHYKEAKTFLSKAAHEAPEWPEAVEEFGACLDRMSAPEADAVLNWSLVAARKNADMQMEAYAMRDMAWYAQEHRDMATTSRLGAQCLELAKRIQNLRVVAGVENSLGVAAERQGLKQSALEHYQAGLSASQVSGNRFQEISSLTNLGNLQLADGDLAGAEYHYQEAAVIARQIGDESNEALTLNNLGIVFLTNFKLREAQAALEHSLALREKNGEARWIPSGQRNLGVVAQMAGDSVGARTWFTKSFASAISVPDDYAAGQARYYLGHLERSDGYLLKALEILESARKAIESDPSPYNLGQTLAGEAECYLRLHRRKEALPFLARAQQLIPGNPYLLRAQAWDAFLRGDRRLALERVDQAMLDPKHEAPEIQRELKALRQQFQ